MQRFPGTAGRLVQPTDRTLSSDARKPSPASPLVVGPEMAEEQTWLLVQHVAVQPVTSIPWLRNV